MKTILLLLIAATATAQERFDVFKLDFGPTNTCAKGYIANDGGVSDPRFLWKGRVSTRDRDGDDMINRDFVEGRTAELIIGLDNGDYELSLTFGDKNYAHGPFNVFVQGRPALEKLTTKKGEFISRTCSARVEDARLRIKFVPVAGGVNFTITSLVVRGPKQVKEHPLDAEGAPAKTIPTLAEIAAAGKSDPRKTLRAYCDWLLAHRTEAGFFEQNSSEWYRASYPIRTLLAGYHIFGDKKYLDAVTACLDKLVSEQLPNSAWSSGFRNKPVAERTADEIEQAIKGTTNTADVGSISTCLAIAYPYVDERRKKVYLAALKRYAENYAAQWQLPSGGFTNGRWHGMDIKVPYSVATGTQGMSFCALYAITGDARYLKIAERAVGFLLDNWLEDGRPIHHHHEKPTSSPEKVTSFGNIYYYHEAILWVWHWTKDEALKEKTRRVYGWHIKGVEGLLQARENGVWWPVSHPWTNSKAAAMPLVFLEYDRSMAKDAEVHEAVERCASFLCHPAWAERIGIMCAPDMPWGKFAMPATGFGGLTLAEIIEPGVIYLRAKCVGLLAGLEGVYDKLGDETATKPPAVCMIDMTHPDTVREGLKKPAGQGHLAYVTKIRTRVPELSGLRCVIVHYTQITAEDLPKTNFKALLIDRIDKSINKDYLEQFYRLVRETRLPAIGFCGGGQLIAQAFGGEIGFMRKLRPGEIDLRPSYHPGRFKEWGFYPVRIVKRDPLFDGLGDQITVQEYHAWEIKKLPDEFEVLASTDECRIQVIKHKTRPLYGTQFHSEHYTDEHADGKKLLQNFFTIVLGRTGTGRPLLTAQRADGGFDGWKTFHEKDGTKTGDVWRLQPDGVLVCKGQPRGYLYTEAAHRNFTLRVEWRYPAGTKGGKGGVLVRMTGEHAIWPRCFECQLNQGAAGDVWAIRGYEFTGPADQLKVTPQSAFGVLRHLKRLADVEKPAGEWNVLEAVVDGATITQTVNGKLVSKATGCEVVAGKILLTSEGSEIHFRNIQLTPR